MWSLRPFSSTARSAFRAVSSGWHAPGILGWLPSVSSAFLHTSLQLDSRIKYRHTHKPFWHVKKTAKQADDPVTPPNRSFIDHMKAVAYSQTKPHGISEEEEKSPLRAELAPWPLGKWNEAGKNTRTGVIGRKVGQQLLWTKSGKRLTATLIQIEDNHVIKYLTAEEYARTVVGEKLHRPNIYTSLRDLSRGCLVVGALSGDPEKFTKDYCGLFTDSGVMPKKKLSRFPVTDNAILQPGTPLYASHFQPGQFIDVVGTSARRGFQGVMKRWGFHGMPKAHGVSKSHRRPGAIGSGSNKHRVWPRQKMPGHMGGSKIRMAGLEILRINYKENILYVKGVAIPGEHGEIVRVMDSTIPSKKVYA